ncbi:MAG TPA: hypothetical protein VI457_10945 [Methylococcaceae bacterium]|nr:hypothetical protein [Methylococcaceae bacterium]
MRKEPLHENHNSSALVGTLKLVVAITLILVAGLAVLWIFEAISWALFTSLAGKTLLVAGIIAVVSCVVAWLMPAK